MVQQQLKLPEGNIYAFPSDVPGATSTPREAIIALGLVQQAAEVFRTLHERVRDTEARAEAAAADASEKLREAEMRAEACEQAYRELLATVDKKLREASAAVQVAEANTRVQIEKRTAAEHRAQEAEATMRGAMRALLSVEEAIRKKLLAYVSQDGALAEAG